MSNSMSRNTNHKSNKATQRAVADQFQSSNATTAAFIGARPRAWMLGDQRPSHLLGDHLQNPLTQSSPSSTAVSQTTAAAPRPSDKQGDSQPECEPLSPTDQRNPSRNQQQRRETCADTGVRPSTSEREARESPVSLPLALQSESSEHPARNDAVSPLVPGNALPSPSPSEERSNDEVEQSRSGKIGLDIMRTSGSPVYLSSSSVISYPDAILTTASEIAQGNMMSIHNRDHLHASTNPPFLVADGQEQRPQPAAVESIQQPQGQNVVNVSAGLTPAPAPVKDHAYPGVQSCLQALTEREQNISRLQDRGPYESPRLGLLKDACMRVDIDYLLIHQIFCWRQLCKGQNLAGMGESHEKGFTVVKYLLASNEDLPPDALNWFARFPTPLVPSLNQSPVVQTRYSKVLRCLAQISDGWDSLGSLSSSRCHPPVVDEIVDYMGVESPVLQHVVFRAILRDIWQPPFDSCFGDCEGLFDKNQELIGKRRRNEPPPGNLSNPELTTMYKTIWDKHQQHIQPRQQRKQQIQPHAQLQSSIQSVARPNREPSHLQIDVGAAQRRPGSIPANPTEEPHPLRAATVQAYSRAQIPNTLQGQQGSFASNGQSTPQSNVFAQFPTPAQSPISQTPQTNLNFQSPEAQSMPGSRRSSQNQGNGALRRPFQPNGANSPRNTVLPMYLPLTSGNNISASLPPAQLQAMDSLLRRASSSSVPQQQANILYQLLASDKNLPFTSTLHTERPNPSMWQGQVPTQPQQQIPRQAQQQLIIQSQQQMPLQQQQHQRQQIQTQQQMPPQQQRRQSQPQQQMLHQQQQQRLQGQPQQQIPLQQQQQRQQGQPQQQIPLQQQQQRQQGQAQQQTPLQVQQPMPLQQPQQQLMASQPQRQMLGQPHQQTLSQPQLQMLGLEPFIQTPKPNSITSLPSQPNPAMTAVHQIHAVSPRLSSADLRGPQTGSQCFGYIENVYMLGPAMNKFKTYQKADVTLDEGEMTLAQDITIPMGLGKFTVDYTYNSEGALVYRYTPHGSVIIRIKCLKSPLGVPLPTAENWAASENTWPAHIAVFLNDLALDIRRKSHFGKDLPTDVTSLITARENSLTLAIMDQSDAQYSVGLEVIRFIDRLHFTASIFTLPPQASQERIRSRITNGHHPDIEVVGHAQITIDLTDPFTSKIFDVPVRGKYCDHHQCFDLDVFLETRARKTTLTPSDPEELRCPICKADAQPQRLFVDGFFLSVREELSRRNRLDVKAIVFRETGEWEIKEEAAMGESGDGDGRRPAAAGAQEVHKPRAQVTVIDLEDED